MNDVSPGPAPSAAALRRTESRIRDHLRRAAPAGLTRDSLGDLLKAEGIDARHIGGLLGGMVAAGTLRMASSEAGLLFWLPPHAADLQPPAPANRNAGPQATPHHHAPAGRPRPVTAPAPTTPVVHARGLAMPPPPRGAWPERQEAPAPQGIGRFAFDVTLGCGAGLGAVALLWAFGVVTIGGGL